MTSAERARPAALDLLDRVLGRGRPLDEVLASVFAEGGRHAGLSGRDRAFVRLLVATVLRRLGQLDAAIDHCLERPLPARARRLRDTLRLGAAQLLFLGTPPHAAVDATVRAGPREARLKGLVNALLRRLAREGAELVTAQDAMRLNTPDWLWRAWCAAYGEDTTRAIAAAHLAEPPLDLTLKDPDEQAARQWAERLGARRLATGSLRLEASGPIERLAGFGDGAWWVQDAAAALPARLFGDIAGRLVIDVGAAPGGKTAQLAAAGARVVALDRSPKRLRIVHDNLARLGLAAECVAAEGTEWRPQAHGLGAADAVLLDAPCSATGTIRRHPDILRLKTPADIERLGPQQARLLAAAVDMLRPGGVLVYATCSLQPEEGVQRIEALLRAGAPVERQALQRGEVCGWGEAITAAGDLQTLPCHLPTEGGLDGFFAARLVRRG